MCQLLGVCANREVDISFSFEEWKYRGETNPHGYGFAFWQRGKLQIVKDAASLYRRRSDAAAAIRDVRSRIFVAHVRFASCGEADGVNTHPFRAEFRGKEFAFAHNGTVGGIFERPLQRRQPLGETDSEHAFLWLLEQLEETPPEEFAGRLKELAAEISALGRFNFLLSDGETLWAHAHDALWLLQREPPHDRIHVRLPRENYSIWLSEVKAPNERAVLVATQPLTKGESWERLRPGELLVIRNGRVEQRLG